MLFLELFRHLNEKEVTRHFQSIILMAAIIKVQMLTEVLVNYTLL